MVTSLIKTDTIFWIKEWADKIELDRSSEKTLNNRRKYQKYQKLILWIIYLIRQWNKDD